MTAPPVTQYDTMLPVRFDAPLQNPAPGGLYAVVTWTEVGEDEPSRHLTGVEIREAGNYPGDQTGVWDADWCGVPDLDGPRKEGDRADRLEPFTPVVVWAYDSCDLTAPSRAEVEARAAQALRIRESVMVGREFAERLKLDAAEHLDPAPTVDDPAAALGRIEAALAEANAVGAVHISPHLRPLLVSRQLLRPNNSGGYLTPGGHRLIFDGGYVAGLDDQIIATSMPLFGWRDQPVTRTTVDEQHNLYIAISERSVVVGYESVLAAVELETP